MPIKKTHTHSEGIYSKKSGKSVLFHPKGKTLSVLGITLGHQDLSAPLPGPPHRLEHRERHSHSDNIKPSATQPSTRVRGLEVLQWPLSLLTEVAERNHTTPFGGKPWETAATRRHGSWHGEVPLPRWLPHFFLNQLLFQNRSVTLSSNKFSTDWMQGEKSHEL